MKPKWCFVLIAATIVGVSQPSVAYADAFTVTLDTSGFTGPLAVFFQLTDGSLLGDANNVVTLDEFTFGGGSALEPPVSGGGASGDLTNGVVLTDSEFFTFFTQGFQPGQTLSFRLNMTAFVDTGGTPDAFAFTILDAAGSPIPTSDPTGADTLLTVTFDSSNPVIANYGVEITPVPEPGTLALLGIGLAGAAGRAKLRIRRHRR